MDYRDGEELWHFQWDMLQDPARKIFKWWQNEQDAEEVKEDIISPKWFTLTEDISGLFITPARKPIYLSLNANDSIAVLKKSDDVGIIGELETRAIYGFSQNGTLYYCEMKGNEFVDYHIKGTSESFVDESTDAILHDSRIHKIHLWDISSNKLITQNWINYDKNKEYLFYDKTTNTIVIVTDIEDLHWLILGEKTTDISQLSNVEIEIYTEKELLDSKYNINNGNTPLSLSLVDFPIYELIFSCIDCTCDAFISAIFVGETEDCMRVFWNNNKKDFINGIINDKKQLAKILDNLTNMNDLLNVLRPKFNQLFSQENVKDAMVDCLSSYAKSLCPMVDSFDENAKQRVFTSNSRQTIGVLLYEFANGKGPSTRLFDCTKGQKYPFVEQYLRGRLSVEIKNDLRQYLESNEISRTDFMQGKVKIDEYLYLELTPGKDLPIKESIKRHITSNLEQIFIGGAVISSIEPYDQKSIVKVTVKNTTGMNSLFLHLTDDIERTDGQYPYPKLSNINQEMTFLLDLDEVSEVLSATSDTFEVLSNSYYVEGNLLVYVWQQRLQKKLLLETPLRVIVDIINLLKEHYE